MLVFLVAETSTSTHVAAERLDLHLVLQQLGAHALGLGVRLVDLVDRDDHRHLRRLGVIDRLDRLRHDAVVGGDHQHDDVGDLGAARAHRREGGVAGRVDEGDLAARRRGHLIGADVLGDAAGFAADHVGRADGVEQRGLAVVDVAHDGHDRRARLQRRRIVGGVEQAFLDVGFGDAPDGVAEFLGDELGGVGVDHVVDLRHLALLHQDLDDVDRALGHAVGEFLDGDRFRDRHFADELFLRLVVALLRCVRCMRRRNDATERSRTSSALSAVTSVRRPRGFSVAVWRAGRRCGGAAGAHGAAGAAARHARRFVFFGFERRDARRGRGLAAVSSSSPKRFLATSSALRLVSSSCLRRSSSSRLRASAASRSAFSMASRCCADLRLFLGDLALFGLAQAGVAERVGAAARSSSVSVRSTTPDGFGAGAAGAAWRAALRRRPLRRRGVRRRALGDRRGAAGAAASGLPSAPTDAALLDLLDDHLLAAAMAEALAHHARLGARLERQRRSS